MARIKNCTLKTSYIQQARIAQSAGESITPIIQAYANDLQVSMQAAYKTFKSEGLLKPRKQRADKGTSIVAKDDALKVASLVMKAHPKVKGKRGLPVSEAVKQLRDEGLIAPAHDSTYQRAMARHRYDKGSRGAQPPHITLRSLCPGDVYEIDASQAKQWYLIKGELVLDPETALLEYKSDKMREATLKRYILVDHYTSAFWVYYAYAKGENASDYMRALWEGCRYKGKDFPLGGLSRLLFSDAGSALKSAVATNVFTALGVQYANHMPGNPRAKGAVESRHGWWEAKFEAKLLAMNITRFSIDELNEMAFEQSKLWNEETANARIGMAPFELWRRWDEANPEAALSRRYPPEWETIQELMVGRVYNGKVYGDWTVRFEGRLYDLARLKGYESVQPRHNVDFTRDPLNRQNIVIDTPDGQRHVIAPVVLGMDGRPVDAPVIGLEYKSKPDDMATKARKEALAAPIPQPPADDKIIKVSFIKSGDSPSPQTERGQGGEVDITAPVRMIARLAWIDAYAAARKVELREAANEYRLRYGDAESAPAGDIQKTDSEILTERNMKGENE